MTTPTPPRRLARHDPISFLPVWLVFVIATSTGQANSLLPALPDAGTPLQRARYQSLPRAAQIDAYLRSIADGSTHVRAIEIGRSVQGRPLRALLVSDSPDFSDESDPAKLTVLLVGSQHPSEASGAEALQILAHQLGNGQRRALLDAMNFVIIADSNPDGRELKRRTNANGINLSTDYLLLSQPESRAIVSVIRRYRPHVLIDLHESAVWKKSSLGAEGYMTDFEAQLETGNQANIDGRIRAWASETFLPAMIDAINHSGLRAAHYTGEITSTRQPIEHGGFTVRNLRNYAAYRATVSLLIENRIDPPGRYPTVRNIEQRTRKQYLSVTTALERIATLRPTIRSLVREAREGWRNGRGERTLMLRSAYVQDPQRPSIDMPLRNIRSGRIEPVRFANHTVLQHSLPWSLPSACAITKEQDWVATFLERHGIEYDRLRAPRRVQATLLAVTRMTLSPKRVIRGRVVTRYLSTDIDQSPSVIKLNTGDLVVDMTPPIARLLLDAFHPQSSSSVFHAAQHTMRLLAYQPFFMVPITGPAAPVARQ